MANEDHLFNYADLNLDFLELSPPKKKINQKPVAAANYTESFRANSYKAKNLAQRVAQNDALVHKIELLKRENSDVQQKLRDFQKSANQIQKLYENEKNKCMDLQMQLNGVEHKTNDLQDRCARLNNEVAEKKMQLEQLEAKLDNTKGPLNYTELVLKYLKLVKKLHADDTIKLCDKPLIDDLCKYCEERGMKVPIIKVKTNKKHKKKKDRDIDCNLLSASESFVSKEVNTQSTQTSVIQSNQMYSQTVATSVRDMQTQTPRSEINSTKNTQDQAVQTRLIDLRTQGTQHISTTTTRGTSTSCFIKKHNIGTIFPEPKLIPPEVALIDKFFETWKVSPLSPISDPISETPINESELSIPSQKSSLPDPYKSVGTCTYLCNVQRQIDYIPIMDPIKRSQSSSPSPFIYDNVKYEVNATPAPSPPPAAALSRPQLNENSETPDGPTNNNLNNLSILQPMISALTELPEMHPEIFSTVWQMAGQMFMGLLYSPTSNHLRAQQFNRSGDSHNLQQFQNWIQSLYESRQMSQQQTASSLQTQCNQQINNRVGTFDSNSVINTNTTQSNDVSTQSEGTPVAEVSYIDRSNAMTDFSNNNSIDGSTQTHNESGGFEKWIFKEPLEVPRKSVKQLHNQSMATEEPVRSRKRKDKKNRKKREEGDKIKLHATSKINEDSHSKAIIERFPVNQNEQNFETAVEFCANLYSSNQDLRIENDQTVVSESITLHLQNVPIKKSVNMDQTGDEKQNNTNKDINIITGKEKLNVLCANETPSSSFKVKNDANVVMVEHINVPDVTLSDSENIENRYLIENQTEICENKIKQNSNLVYTIFGSDSDEDDNDDNNITITNDVNTEISGFLEKSEQQTHHKENSEDNMLKESNNIEIIPENKRELTENEVEFSSEKFSIPYQQINTGTAFSNIQTLVLPTIIAPKSSTLTKEIANPVTADNYVQQLSVRTSEYQNNEPILIKKETSVQPVYHSNSENEDVDEPKLVIVERSPETNCKKRTKSDSSVDYDAIFDDSISEACSKKLYQPSSSDADTSILPEGSIIDNFLENGSRKQLVNSILSESANEQKETGAGVPCKRGRKRKTEMPDVTFFKRAARLPDKQMRDNQFSSKESLSSPNKNSNHQPNLSDQCSNDDSCKDKEQQFANLAKLWQAKDKVVHSLTENHINDQFQIYTELKQRENNDKYYKDQSIGDMLVDMDNTFEETVLVAETSNTAINKPGSTISRPFEDFATEHSLECCPEPFTSFQQNVKRGGTLEDTLASHSTPSLEMQLQNGKVDLATPASPPPEIVNENTLTNTQIEIPLELNRIYCPPSLRKSILHNIINKYSSKIFSVVIGKRKESEMETKIAIQIKEFLDTTLDQVNLTASILTASLHEQLENCDILADIIIDQICIAPLPEIELNCELTRVPPIGTHLRLILILLRHLRQKRPEIIAAILRSVEKKLFNYQKYEAFSLSVLLNLTQLYLVVIPLHNAEHNPARLFIAKCLYFHNIMSSPMIYEVLCWYPTTLPHRDDSHYDKSDALITVIQHILMCTTYNMDSKDLRHRELLSLLRFEYHFEPFQPKALEVLSNLVTKLKAGNLTNLMYAFAVFCKRNVKLVDILLQQQLLPLADQYYKLVQHTNEYDERIACLLASISAVVRPLPLTTDVSVYLSIFERFLGVVRRSVVQEAAVLAILRLQRFCPNRCFHALAHFKPTYPLQLITTNALKTFIHKKPLKYWNSLMQSISN